MFNNCPMFVFKSELLDVRMRERERELLLPMQMHYTCAGWKLTLRAWMPGLVRNEQLLNMTVGRKVDANRLGSRD